MVGDKYLARRQVQQGALNHQTTKVVAVKKSEKLASVAVVRYGKLGGKYPP